MQYMLERIEEYQNGKLSFEKTVMLFQQLVDTGMLWRVNENILKDVYELIERGYVLKL